MAVFCFTAWQVLILPGLLTLLPMKYKLLGRSGLKVSELCLGTMGFGTEGGWGADAAASFTIMEKFAEAGGNFLDTANIYKLGTSEKIIGEFISSRDRDFFVIATKYSLLDNTTNPNASGNNRKNMMRSVEASLKRLQTDFIDVLYLHIWDDLTPIDEVLRGLDDLIRQGKVNYAAISDTPAWVVAKGNTMAELMGWSQFIALQVEYSLLSRTPEHTRHLRIHEGHCTYLLDEERPLLTPNLVRATTVVGTAEECIEQIRRLEAAGVTQLVVLPGLGHQEAYAERFARQIIDRY